MSLFSKQKPKPVQRKKLLIVDDEPSIRGLLQTYLQENGYEVFIASKGSEALEIMHSKSPDMALLDIMLADENGLELLTQVKEINPDTPVLIMTSMGYEEDLLQEAKNKGANSYISKHLPLDQLLMEIHRQLNFKK